MTSCLAEVDPLRGIVPGYEDKQLYLEDEPVPPLQNLGPWP